jgi:transcriptional regulator with XRE-family HTH domain
MGRLREQFGKHLLSIRRQRRLTQEQFSELVGISVDFLSLIERGLNAPSFETLEQLADRLDVPVAYLFMFDELKSGGTPNVRGKKRHASRRSPRRSL